MSLQATRGSEEESGALGRAQVASGGEAGEPDAGGCRGGSPRLGRAQVPGLALMGSVTSWWTTVGGASALRGLS